MSIVACFGMFSSYHLLNSYTTVPVKLVKPVLIGILRWNHTLSLSSPFQWFAVKSYWTQTLYKARETVSPRGFVFLLDMISISRLKRLDIFSSSASVSYL